MNAAPSSRFPTFRKAVPAALGILRTIPRLLRWFRRLLFSRTSFKSYLILATLICLTYTSLRWLGRRAWQTEQARAAAAGMAMDFKSLIKPMPKDEDNFLAADVFKPLFSPPPGKSEQFTMWFSNKNYAKPYEKRQRQVPKPKNGTSAEWCAYFRLTGMLPETPTHSSPAEEICSDPRWLPTFQEVYAAAARPESRFPLVADAELIDIFRARIDPGILMNFQRSLMVYAQAQLEAGRLTEAMPALLVWDHFSRAYFAEPDLIPHLIGNQILRETHALLKTGMRQHQWTAPFLTKLLETKHALLYREASQRAFQWERVGCGRIFEKFPESAEGYFYFKESSFSNFFLKHFVPDYFPMRAAVRTSQHLERLHAAAANLEANEPWSSRTQSLATSPKLHLGPKAIFGCGFMMDDPVQFFLALHVVPIIQASLRHLAIALELHYLSHGKYPPSLGELDIPVPIDPLVMKDIDGQSIRYTTDAAGSHFTLRSVGKNGVPDVPGQQTDDLVFSTAPEN
jgi:hypothetical protein